MENDPYNQKLPSLDELRTCIPKKCFEKSLPLSLFYLLLDFLILALLYKTQPLFETLGILGIIFCWFVYTIVGVTDGSHFWPFSSQFKSNTERLKCVVSVSVCLVYGSLAYAYFGSLRAFLKFYVLPVLSQGCWLTMVTYLQHQTDDIRVYEDGNWSYVKGQLQTIDRPYGFGIDQVMHHITDGHVAHHLFFTAIPHYHLMEATEALQEKLRPYGVYRKHTSYDFLFQFASLNRRLKYLVGEGTGHLFYAREKQE